MAGTFRWVYHKVYGLKLFYDIRFGKSTTCTKEEEFFPIEIKIPEPVLKMIAGAKVPDIPKGMRQWGRI